MWRIRWSRLWHCDRRWATRLWKEESQAPFFFAAAAVRFLSSPLLASLHFSSLLCSSLLPLSFSSLLLFFSSLHFLSFSSFVPRYPESTERVDALAEAASWVLVVFLWLFTFGSNTPPTSKRSAFTFPTPAFDPPSVGVAGDVAGARKRNLTVKSTPTERKSIKWAVFWLIEVLREVVVSYPSWRIVEVNRWIPRLDLERERRNFQNTVSPFASLSGSLLFLALPCSSATELFASLFPFYALLLLSFAWVFVFLLRFLQFTSILRRYWCGDGGIRRGRVRSRQRIRRAGKDQRHRCEILIV